jgi:hypothetical protein
MFSVCKWLEHHLLEWLIKTLLALWRALFYRSDSKIFFFKHWLKTLIELLRGSILHPFNFCSLKNSEKGSNPGPLDHKEDSNHCISFFIIIFKFLTINHCAGIIIKKLNFFFMQGTVLYCTIIVLSPVPHLTCNYYLVFAHKAKHEWFDFLWIIWSLSPMHELGLLFSNLAWIFWGICFNNVPI